MARVVIKWNRKAFPLLRTLPATDAMLKRSADAIRDGCGDGYEAFINPGRTRSRAAVVTTTVEAMVDNATQNRLLTNLDRGRV